MNGENIAISTPSLSAFCLAAKAQGGLVDLRVKNKLKN